jgi:GNAT superfamily N-acetyltransferase
MEVAPLRNSSIDQLRAVLREELETWDSQLTWDYGSAQELVKTFLSAGSMPGFTVTGDSGEPVGYTYYVIDRPVAFIGATYVQHASAGPEAYRLLLEPTISFLTKLKIVDRIEAQLFPFNYDHEPIFTEHGFTALKRFFLSLELSRNTPLVSEQGQSKSRFRMIPWKRDLLKAGSEVIHDSYIGSPDHGLCRDYQSTEGCLRLLTNLTESPACGKFSDEDTKLAVDGEGELCGVLVATRIRADTGMVPQLSIRRDCQGKGLGTRLMKSYLLGLQRQGLKRATLSVSQANSGAHRLYCRLGFELVKEFHAFIWLKRQS